MLEIEPVHTDLTHPFLCFSLTKQSHMAQQSHKRRCFSLREPIVQSSLRGKEGSGHAYFEWVLWNTIVIASTIFMRIVVCTHNHPSDRLELSAFFHRRKELGDTLQLCMVLDVARVYMTPAIRDCLATRNPA